jgi:hypothetical protein
MALSAQTGKSSSRAPDCTRCKHFYRTGRTPFSHGCRAYAFEAPTYPSLVVERESGRACQLFEAAAPRSSRPAGGEARDA